VHVKADGARRQRVMIDPDVEAAALRVSGNLTGKVATSAQDEGPAASLE